MTKRSNVGLEKNAGDAVKAGPTIPDMSGLWYRFQQTANHALPQRFANLRCCISWHPLRQNPEHIFTIWKGGRGNGQLGNSKFICKCFEQHRNFRLGVVTLAESTKLGREKRRGGSWHQIIYRRRDVDGRQCR